MYGRGGFPPNFGPNYRPGMPGPGPRGPPFQYGDPRFRGPPPHRQAQMSEQQGGDSSSSMYEQPAIVKETDLKEFDQILKHDSQDGGWAGAQGDVDYSEKLVFSDDEDTAPAKDSK